MHGEHAVPPGDLGVVAVISVDRREAGRRIRTIKAILDALEEPYTPIEGGIALVRRPFAFQVFTATIAGVSGFTCIFALCDEVAKWRDADTGANPAREVLASLRPTMATQRNAKIVLSSSPLGSLDAHAQAFDEGDTPAQVTAFAPTWVANPTLTEEETRRDEPDEAKWRREYGAEPLEGDEESLLSAAAIDARVVSIEGLHPFPGYSYVAAMDPATRGNGWTLVVSSTDPDRVRTIVAAHERRGSPSAPLDPDRVLEEYAGILAPFHVKIVHTDQWSGDANASIARRHRLTLVQSTLSAGEKLSMWEDVSTMVRDKAVRFLDHKQLRADLLGVRRRITPSGVRIVLAATPDGRHSDYAPPTALCLMQPCALPRTIETVEETRERHDIERAKRKWGPGKPRQRYWQRGPQ